MTFDEKHDNVSTRNAVPPIRVRDVEGIVGGGLFGALLAGGLMNLVFYELMMQFAQIVGSFSHTVAWLVLFGLGVVFAAGFEVYVRLSFDPFVRSIIALTKRSSILRKLLSPMVHKSPMGSVCYLLGQGYGLAIGVGHVLLVPLWLTHVMGVPTPFPMLNLHGLLAVVGWVVYGSMMALVFGLVVET